MSSRGGWSARAAGPLTAGAWLAPVAGRAVRRLDMESCRPWSLLSLGQSWSTAGQRRAGLMLSSVLVYGSLGSCGLLAGCDPSQRERRVVGADLAIIQAKEHHVV